MKTKIIPALLAAPLMLLITGCPKAKQPVAPPPDTEFHSTVDVSYALLAITDAEMISSFVADNDFSPDFYLPAPGSPGLPPVQNPESGYVSAVYDNGVNCVDSKFRMGTVSMDRHIDVAYNPYANGNSLYYRRFGFAGRLSLGEFYVDGWKIEVTNDNNEITGNQECQVVNKLTSANWDPNTTNLSWSIKGNFRLTKGNEMIFCKVDLVKTLVNTSDPAVYPRSTVNSINWRLAKVAYTGVVTGFTPDHIPFSMVINNDKPLTRDFTCSPNRIGNATEFHPFTSGVASLTTADLYPRQINYGGSESDGEGQCDNSGSILIKGISYPVDFKQ